MPKSGPLDIREIALNIRTAIEDGIELMPIEKPQLDKCGHTYDFSTWQDLNRRAEDSGKPLQCPDSQAVLDPKKLYPNLALRHATEELSALAEILENQVRISNRNRANLELMQRQITLKERQLENLTSTSWFWRLDAEIWGKDLSKSKNYGLSDEELAILDQRPEFEILPEVDLSLVRSGPEERKEAMGK